MDQEKILKDIFETVTFLRDRGASKDDLAALERRMDKKLDAMKGELLTHIDGFIVLNQKVDTELTAMRALYARLDRQVQQLARHMKLDLQ